MTTSSSRHPRALTMLAPIALTMATISAATASTSGSDSLNKPAPKRRRMPSMPYIRQDDLRKLMGSDYDPIQAENWVSMSEDVEFLPVLNNEKINKKKNGKDSAATSSTSNTKPSRTRSLEQGEGEETTTGAWDNYDPYSVQPFVEGMSGYDEYQQAWRLLGFTIDCQNPMDDDYEMSGGSQDEITEEGCARYVIWAAYVDLEYEGGGIGEYQYWDRETESWDETPCQYAEGGSHRSGDEDGDGDNNGGSRCAKMDCHLEDTHFSVLGFFKHRNYDDWMEQLFKHEGMCVWTEEEYAFMKGARKAWPKGCADTGSTVTVKGDDGDATTTLYYNIKPLPSGRIAVGLYTDEQCITEYPADTDYVEQIVGNVFLNADSHNSNDNGNYDFSGDSLADSMDRWDSAFDVWHTCHPCVAYDLENTGGNKYTDDDDGYYYYDDANGARGRGLGGEYNAQGDVFECYDDAGYTNVNQCMKFSAKTVMKTATFRDLSLGRNQGSLVEYPLSGFVDSSKQYQQEKMGTVATYFFLVGASSALCLSLWNLYRVVKQSRRGDVGGSTNSDSLLV